MSNNTKYSVSPNFDTNIDDFVNFPSRINQNSLDFKNLKRTRQESSKLIMDILLFLLFIAVVAFLSICALAPKYFSNSEKLSLINQSPRILNELQISQSILKKLSAEEVPRWYDLNPQSSQFTFLANSAPQSSLLDVELSSKGSNKFEDALSIIFDDQTQLNNEIVAKITGEKMKMAKKLLKLNSNPSEHAQFIYRFQQEYFESRYHINSYKQLPICVVVPTYQNVAQDRYRSNMESIIQQDYSNFKIIVIDDASLDGTADKILQYISEQNVGPNKFKLIRNERQMKAMFNIKRAAREYCRQEDIMIIVDGDDQLVGKQVFKLFNAVFQQKGVWFVYSNFINLVSQNVGYSRPYAQTIIDQNQYRSHDIQTSHLRAFYTKLFLNIKEEDLKDESGKYYQAANDVAICLPILEMSHRRVFYLPEITYGYNSNTGNNNHLIRIEVQIENNHNIRKKPKYLPLAQLFESD